MTGIEEVRRLLDSMNEQERREAYTYLRTLLPKHPMEERLMISSEGMLDALARAGDFTVRMIRGVFAEAAFSADVLPTLAEWRELPLKGDPPFDFLVTDVPGGQEPISDLPYPVVKVQVKMQRSQGRKPRLAKDEWKTYVKWPGDYFVVEVQKSRKGEKKGENTRPLRFGEFDILAVSLGPSRGRWSEFMYTLERWLLHRPDDEGQILQYQPVAPHDTDCWTTDFRKAVEWLRSGEERRITGDIPAFRQDSRRQRRPTSL